MGSKWQRIEEGETKRREVAPGQKRWTKVTSDEQFAAVRGVQFANMLTGQHIEMQEYLDFDDKVVKREGDLRLQELMNFTTSIEEEFDDMDRDMLMDRATPYLQRLIKTLTGEDVSEEEIKKTIDVRCNGNWRGFKKGPKYQRLN